MTIWKETKNGFYFNNLNIRDVIEEVKQSSLSKESKNAILSYFGGYISEKTETSNYIRERIILVLTDYNKPMRITEIIEETGMPFTNQKVSAMARQLCVAGIVERTEINTGKKIEIAPNNYIDETIAYFSLK